MKKILLILLAVVWSFSFLSGCKSSAENTAGIYDDYQLTLSGLESGDAIITIAELKQMASEELTCESVTKDGTITTVTATAVTLDTILSAYGVSQSGYDYIILTADDGYNSQINSDILTSGPIYFAYYQDGAEVAFNTIIPGQSAIYWVKNVSSIELGTAEETTAVSTVYFLDALYEQADSFAFNDGQAVVIGDLFALALSNQPNMVSLMSNDEWGRNDKLSTVAELYLQYKGENSPRIDAPELPQGMRIDNLLRITAAETCLVSLRSADGILGDNRLTLKEILLCSNMPEYADGYIAHFSDGTTLALPADEISDITFAIDEVCTLNKDGKTYSGVIYLTSATADITTVQNEDEPPASTTGADSSVGSTPTPTKADSGNESSGFVSDNAPGGKLSASGDVSGIAFSVAIGGQTLTDQQTAQLPVYTGTATVKTQTGTADAVYTGYMLQDILDLLGVTLSGTVSIVASDGYTITFEAADIDNNTLLALSKDGESGEGPYFAPCSAEYAKFFAKMVASIK